MVTRSDVQVVNVGGGHAQPEPQAGKPHPRILHIIDDQGATEIGGYYIRMPNSAFIAYGDLLPECEAAASSGPVTRFFTLPRTRSARHFSTKSVWMRWLRRTSMARYVRRGRYRSSDPCSQCMLVLYFPIPEALEPFLVPRGDAEIRLELHCDWIDMRTAKHWTSREAAST